MTDSTFRSPFQKEMRELVETKRAAGFKYDAGEKALLRLDAFLCREYPDVAELSRDVVLHWCEKRPWEKATNRSRRVSTIRQFAVFLRQCGQDAWVAPPGLYPKGEKYVPHIYTEDELSASIRPPTHAIPAALFPTGITLCPNSSDSCCIAGFDARRLVS